MYENIKASFEYHLIYIFRINDEKHEGLLKIGETTIPDKYDITELKPSVEILNEYAHKRIKKYTSTAGITYELLYTELAIKDDGGLFRDHDVHNVLKRSGINTADLGTNSREWFEVSLETAKNAIKAVKEGRTSLNNNDFSDKPDPIVFRPEQYMAIHDTVKRLKKHNKMLWNAKMRFGKTLSALEVIKQLKFTRTLILTHRPVVDSSWYEDFKKIFVEPDNKYNYGSKKKGERFDKLTSSINPFVYFASLQDLRGSKDVGGNFDKNNEIFSIDWDFLIVDEAHEGIKTELASKVLKKIIGKQTKKLYLSGTPFNIMNEFEDEKEIYTWDYVQEQEAKEKWDKESTDHNPYYDLPKMNIYTYHLNDIIRGYSDFEDASFNFKEFFRVWTGDIKKDFEKIPSNKKKGDFVHEEDVKKLLDLMVKKDENTFYPYSNETFRSYFNHSLWMVPGVKEAKALSKLLKEHEVFSNFEIINVAGEGDEEKPYKDALDAVNEVISDNPEETYSITLSCGKLTTGVSIKEWTAVFMLSGSSSTSAQSYLQTIFRVQTPAKIGGKIKQNCYVFDFAPDRTLKILSQYNNLSVKKGSINNEKEKQDMQKFLNFCPVISVKGSEMKPYDVNSLLRQLKKAYADKVVQNGFDDLNLYNDYLLQLNKVDLNKFNELEKIVGKSKQQTGTKKFNINDEGFDDAEIEQTKKAETKPKKELTHEEKELLEKLKKIKKNRQKAIGILRSISIRIPLMIYGANIPFEEEVTVDNFTDLVDDKSWEEFMPKGVTKEKFNEFSKYYDAEIFVNAGRKIRNTSKEADNLDKTNRINKISTLFSTFKDPDKETVLTPWRVVNMHISDILGGYSFYDDKFKEQLEEPRYVRRGNVTVDTIANINSKLLEINSKSGLYGLYLTYSLFRNKLSNYDEKEITKELQEKIWQEVIENNIFIICKTKMAQTITQRTLAGYQENIKFNVITIENMQELVDKDEGQYLTTYLSNSKTWTLTGEEIMKFDAIVANPPYQEMDGGAQASSVPIYNKFVKQAISLEPKYISMIIPARWFTGGRNLDKFREDMLNDKRISVLHDYFDARDCFPTVEIKGGVCYFLWDSLYDDKCRIFTHDKGNIYESIKYLKSQYTTKYIRYNKAESILDKILNHGEKTMDQSVSSQRPFGFRTYYKGDSDEKTAENNIKVYCNKTIGYTSSDKIEKNKDWLEKHKVILPRAIGSGDSKTDKLKPIYSEPGSCCSETYIVIDKFDNEIECENLIKYIKTKFFHFLVTLMKNDQMVSKTVFSFVPYQDFNEEWDDEKLYKKYNLNEDDINYINSIV